MSLDDALRAPVTLFSREAGALVPVYLLAASVPGVARTPLVAALGVAVASLAVTGRLDPAVAALREADLAPGDAGGAPEALDPTTADALAGLVTPTVVLSLVAGGGAAVVALLLARAAASAATLAAVDAGLRGVEPVEAGVEGTRRHWRAFVGLTLARAAVYAGLGAVVLALVGVGSALGGAASAAFGLLAVVAALPVVVAVELVLGFAGPAVVVDGVGTVGALRRAVGLARRRPGVYAVLALLGLVALVALGVVVGGAALAGVGRVAALGIAVVVLPLFDGLRVALYADRGGVSGARADTGASERGLGLLREGSRALVRFVRDHPVANAASAALFTGGALAGWALVAPYGLGSGAPADVGGVFGAVPVGPFLSIAANNWLVGASAAYGGLAAGLPTVAALVVNGVLLGGVAAATDRAVFLALVAPHATLELPAVVVAGGLGLHLGRVGVGWVRGRRDAAQVGAAVRRAFRVLVGLAVVFVVAAAIEAFVTPAVAARLLG